MRLQSDNDNTNSCAWSYLHIPGTPYCNPVLVFWQSIPTRKPAQNSFHYYHRTSLYSTMRWPSGKKVFVVRLIANESNDFDPHYSVDAATCPPAPASETMVQTPNVACCCCCVFFWLLANRSQSGKRVLETGEKSLVPESETRAGGGFEIFVATLEAATFPARLRLSRCGNLLEVAKSRKWSVRERRAVIERPVGV